MCISSISTPLSNKSCITRIILRVTSKLLHVNHIIVICATSYWIILYLNGLSFQSLWYFSNMYACDGLDACVSVWGRGGGGRGTGRQAVGAKWASLLAVHVHKLGHLFLVISTASTLLPSFLFWLDAEMKWNEKKVIMLQYQQGVLLED